MHSEPPRRRRLDDQGRGGGGGLPLVPLVIVVILGGLLLGAALAHFLGSKNAAVVQTRPTPFAFITPLPVPSETPLPSETPPPKHRSLATPKATASASPSPSPTPSPSVSPSAKPKATASPKAIAISSASPKASPTSPVPTVSPHPPHPVKTASVSRTAAPVLRSPLPLPASERAENVVRDYLNALALGNTSEARSYLASGEPSEAAFMKNDAHLSSLHVSPAGEGTYNVNADIQTGNGEYFVTFTVEVEPGSAIITDHTAIKP